MTSGLFSLPLAPAVSTYSAMGEATRSAGERPADHFIAGPENSLVRTLAEAVTADPPKFNPIALCGALGVGKTTLAYALALRRRTALGLSSTSVITTTAIDLKRALDHAIEADSVADLRARYHRCDLLLIDDVHQLRGKSVVQQFLISSIDALLRRGSQIIVTSRHLPQATDDLQPALTGRLSGGLAIPLSPPGQIARQHLVQQAAKRVNLPLTADVVSALVDASSASPRLATARAIQHAVFQLAAYAPATHSTAADVVDIIEENTPDTKAICRRTASVVARHFGLTASDLRGKSRQQAVADARALAMYLVRGRTGASYAEVGRHFGNRDHTTVLHACRKLSAQTARDQATRRLANDIAEQISEEE